MTSLYRNMQAQFGLTGVRQGVVGDGVSTNPYDDFGFLKVQMLDGITTDGSVGVGTIKRCIPSDSIRAINGQSVWIAPKVGTGFWQVVSFDADLFTQQGVPTNYQQSTPASQNNFYWLRNAADFQLMPATDSNGAYTTALIGLDGIPYWAYNGAIQDMTISATTPLELSSYIPASSNTMRYVFVAHDVTTETDRVISGATKTTTSANITAIEVQALLDDAHNLEMPRKVLRLDSNTTDVSRVKNDMLDLRQFINSPMPTIMPSVISRNWKIPANWQSIHKGQVTITEGFQLIIAEGGQLVIEPEAPNINEKVITTDYYLKVTDDRLNIDASAFDITVFLPDPSITKKSVDITLIDNSGGSLTLDGNGYNINGFSTQLYSSQYDSIRLRPTATEWIIA